MAATERQARTTRQRFDSAARDLQRRYDTLPTRDRDATARTLYSERISRLRALASVASPLKIAERAEIPTGPFSPKPVRAGLSAGLIGLLVGVGLAFLRNALDRRLRGAREIQASLGLPLLGHVREEAMGKAGLAAGSRQPLAAIDLEGFRILRANLELLDAAHENVVILVTSCLPAEGKSTVAASLAFASALAGRRTLLVECDLRRPTLAPRLSLPASPGLVEFLSGEVEAADVTRAVAPAPGQTNGTAPEQVTGAALTCVLSGRSTTHPAELLGSQRMRGFIEEIRSEYDLVIIDSAPLLPVVDTLQLLTSVDAAVLCLRDGRTTHDQAAAGHATLTTVSDLPIALVVTGVRRETSAGYGYYSTEYSYDSR